MRVMQIAGARTRGGLLTHVQALTEGLVRSGHQLDVVVSPDPDIDTVAADLTHAGATVHRMGVRGKMDLAGSRALHRRVAAVQPDVVHLHLSSPVEATSALMAARWAGRHRMVTTEHAPKHAPLRRFYSATVKRALGRRLDRVIAVCRSDADYLVQEFGLESDSITVIANGTVDRKEPLPSREEARSRLGIDETAGFVIGYVGSLSAQKGVRELVDAARKVDIPDLVLALAGRGPLFVALEAQRPKLPYRLELLGQLHDIGSFLACLDAFVLPSHSESMPLALLEAMHAGLPIVSTHVGGIPEALEDGISGILIPPARPRELCAALHSLWSDRKKSARMGAQAQVIARERFTAKRMVAQVEALYEQLLERSAQTGS